MHGIVADCFSCIGCYSGVVIVHLQITTCNRFTYEDVRDQRKHFVTTLMEANDNAVLQYVANVETKVTFAYKDVHFINRGCAADGTWSLPMEGPTTIADALHARKVRAAVVALTPYDGMEPSRAVSTLKEGEDECQYCHMQVNGKDWVLHMAFHVGRGEAVGVCLPCLFCGYTDGTCRLQMNKVRCADAQWQIAPTSCAHHCFRKVNMASLRKQLVHNEPLLYVVP